MRAYWILPNRDQRDEISASDGATILPLRQVLVPENRPEGFSHGIPTELLEKCGEKGFADILFAQRFPEYIGGKQLFAVSSTAGVDSSGRVVHLGLLYILEPEERPEFNLPHAGLSGEDKPYASALIHRLTSPAVGDRWVHSVRELSELPSIKRPTTNVALDRSVVRFDSLYTISPRGLIKVANQRKFRGMVTIILSICAVVSVWIYMHARSRPIGASYSEQSSHVAVRNGVAVWPSN